MKLNIENLLGFEHIYKPPSEDVFLVENAWRF